MPHFLLRPVVSRAAIRCRTSSSGQRLPCAAMLRHPRRSAILGAPLLFSPLHSSDEAAPPPVSKGFRSRLIMVGSIGKGSMDLVNGKAEPLSEEIPGLELPPPEVIGDGVEGGCEKRREIVLGRNVHTTCLTIDEPEADDEVTGRGRHTWPACSPGTRSPFSRGPSTT